MPPAPAPTSTDAPPPRVPPDAELREMLALVKRGLPGEMHSERMSAARDNREFYECRNLAYLAKRGAEDEADFAARPKRCAYIVHQAVNALTRPLYSPGPTRRLADDDADEWLQRTYEQVAINNRMAEADAAATLNDVAAMQVAATGNPDQPFRMWVRGAHEFTVWCPPDDPTTPWAVCTVNVLFAGVKKRKRYQLWTATDVWTFETADTEGAASLDPRTAPDRQVEDETGLHGYGRLPFTFHRNRPSGDSFWGGGIGTPLRICNAEVDRQLSDLAQNINIFTVPDTFTRNVNASFRYKKRPGAPVNLPPLADFGMGDTIPEPDFFFRQPQLDIKSVWDDVRMYVDQTMESVGVPVASVHADAQSDYSSGIAIVARKMPLLEYVKARQPKAQEDEKAVAKLLIETYGNYYDPDGRLKQWAAFASKQDLTTNWPEPAFPMPSDERDKGDLFEMANGMLSLPEAVARRRGITVDQAWDVLKKVAEDQEKVTKIFGTPMPPPANPFAAAPMGGDPNAEADPNAPPTEDPGDAA